MADAASTYSATDSHTRATSWSLPQLTFTQGLLIGQLSIILVVVALIRYLLFEDAAPQLLDDEDEEQPQSGKATRRHFPVSSPPRASSRQSLLSLSLSSAPTRVRSPPPTSASDASHSYGSGPALATLARIPEVVGYDLETAADIDVGWLNVLLAHVWEGYRDDFLAGGSNRPIPLAEGEAQDEEWEDEADDEVEATSAQRTARHLIQDILNRPKIENGKLEFLDQIQVTECLVGDSYPILSNARVRPRDDQGRVRIELDVDYTDLLSLSLQTSLLINYPRPRFAVLPISLGLRITRFSGTISLSFNSSPPSKTAKNKRSRHSLSLSLHPDFLLKATCSSLVGARAKLQDIPKIQQLILQRIRAAIAERLGWPRTFDVEMPDLVRRRRPKRNRGGKKMRTQAEGSQDGSFERGYEQAESSRMGGIAEEEELSLGEDVLQDVYLSNGSADAMDPQLALQARRRRAKARAQAEATARARGESSARTRMDDAQQTPKANRTATSTALRNGTGASPMPTPLGAQRGYSYSSSIAQPHLDTNGVNGASAARQRGGLANGNLSGNNGSSHYTSISRRPPNPRYSSTPGTAPSYFNNGAAAGGVAPNTSSSKARASLSRGQSTLERRLGDEEVENFENGTAEGVRGGKLPTVRDWVQRSNGEL